MLLSPLDAARLEVKKKHDGKHAYVIAMIAIQNIAIQVMKARELL